MKQSRNKGNDGNSRIDASSMQSMTMEPGDQLLMPAQLRQAILQFFQHPDVIAPTGAVLQLVAALGSLRPVEQPKEQ